MATAKTREIYTLDEVCSLTYLNETTIRFYDSLYAEILPLVEKLGVDPQILFDIVSVGGSNCGIFQLFAPKMIKR